MVISWPRREEKSVEVKEAASPWKRVEETQQQPHLPCLLVPQPSHAVLAGDLAAGLLPESFGDLTPEIKQAISMHDTGWALMDAEQIQLLRSGSPQETKPRVPISFIANSPEDVAQAWTASINSVERLSPAGGFIVSQHFALLAAVAGREQERFLAAEKNRSRHLEAKAAVAAADLERWTAVLGFCDLLSLYLLAGLDGAASFPLAHPASAQAESAPRVSLEFAAGYLHFTPQIFPVGFRAQLQALKHPVLEQGARTETLTWEVA